MSFDVNLKSVENVKSIKNIHKTTPIRSNISFGQIKPDKLELSQIAEFEKNLRTNFPQASIRVVSQKDTSEWVMFKGSQFGSQDAFWAKDKSSGNIYYVKYARNKEKVGHIRSEILANRLYQLAGIQTAEVMPIKINGKIPALASKFEPDLVVPRDEKPLQEAFAVDAWLANWDSMLFGNTFVKNGKVIKIDNGGALNYRAEGELKTDFDDTVSELKTFLDGRNKASKRAYSSMTQKELVNSLKKVCDISDVKIKQVVQDELLAKTLINRKKYLKEVLTKIEKNPYKGKNLYEYLKDITQVAEQYSSYNPELLTLKLEDVLNSNISNSGNSQDIPSSKFIAKAIVCELKKLEKNGISVSRTQIIEFLKQKSKTGLLMKNVDFENSVAMHSNMQKKMFARLAMIAERTPQKDGENISDYFCRIERLRENRNKQLDNFRIKQIKSKLCYEVETISSKPRSLTNEERQLAIAELENARIKDLQLDIRILPKLNENATDKQIYNAWKKGHLGSFKFDDKDIQVAVMQLGGRYNSKKPQDTEALYEVIAEKKYKQDFVNEPVYHWFGCKDPEKFVAQLPKVGDIYELPQLHCCSTHKHYAENDYGDHISGLDIKFIMHPKSETSRAYNVGYNQEVVYPKGEKFRILDKELVEYIDPKTNYGYYRWEVHMQEV